MFGGKTPGRLSGGEEMYGMSQGEVMFELSNFVVQCEKTLGNVGIIGDMTPRW